MCAVLGVCEDTLNKWCKRTYKMTFSEAIKSKSCMGKTSLRRTQFKLAEKNAAMAIWLGKQYLGQKEDADISQIGTNVQDDALSQSLRTFAEGVNSDER